jgi:hypothetical protein
VGGLGMKHFQPPEGNRAAEHSLELYAQNCLVKLSKIQGSLASRPSGEPVPALRLSMSQNHNPLSANRLRCEFRAGAGAGWPGLRRCGQRGSRLLDAQASWNRTGLPRIMMADATRNNGSRHALLAARRPPPDSPVFPAGSRLIRSPR